MGLQGTLIAIAIIVVVFMFYGNQIAEGWASFQQQQNQAATANAVKTQPSKGQTVCDLTIHVYPFTESSLPSTSIYIQNSPSLTSTGGGDKNPNPQGYDYTWSNCHQYAIPTLSWLVPQLNFLSMYALDLVTGNINVNLTLQAPDGSQLSSATSGYSLLSQQYSYSSPFGTSQTNTLTFPIHSIPYITYIVGVGSNVRINENPIGQPFYFSVTAS